MSHLTPIPDNADETVATPSILQGLLDQARTLFDAGSVIEQVRGTEEAPTVQLTAATTTAVAQRIVLDNFGSDQSGLRELLLEPWDEDYNVDARLVRDLLKSTFHQFLRDSARYQMTGLLLAQATAWIALRLEFNSDTLSESTRRADYRDCPEQLLAPTGAGNATGSPRRRRRRTTQG